MLRLLLILLGCATLVSCDFARDKKARGTYIGGVIENPRGEYVVLSYNNAILDSVKLDKNNRFSYTIDSLSEGIYTFNHREYQRFYLYPNDSLLIHVNTIDFDESLKYSGIGAEKNNLLMTIFLEDEMVQNKLPEWYLLSPEDYLKKLDSVDRVHQNFRKKFDAKALNTPRKFKQIIDENLTYDLYLWKEMYISTKLKSGGDAVYEELPVEFLKHRLEIDFGNDLMRSHYSYFRFMDNYFNNVAYDTYKNPDAFKRSNFTHAQAKLNAINKLTHHEALKNRLLRRTALGYLMHTTNVEKANALFNKFEKYSSNEKNIEELKHILEQTVNIVPGKKIPNVQLVGLNNEIKTLHKVLNKQCVIYFWTYESAKHYREIHEKAAALKVKFPNYDFIAINADKDFRKWKRIAETMNPDPGTEFQLENLASAKSSLMLDTPEKTIILDAAGNILNANLSITDTAFEEEL